MELIDMGHKTQYCHRPEKEALDENLHLRYVDQCGLPLLLLLLPGRGSAREAPGPARSPLADFIRDRHIPKAGGQGADCRPHCLEPRKVA